MKSKLSAIIIIIYSKLRIVFYELLSTNKFRSNIKKIQPVQFVGDGNISIDKNSSIGYFPSPYFFSTYAYIEARNKEAKIEINSNTVINNGFVAIAEKTIISIGENCLIGAKVEIYDSDFHALSPSDRKRGKSHTCMPVFIEDDVFIGSNVVILKGVTIGKGSVIGNGSVVASDIPPFSIASGVPAKIIRKLTL